MKKLIMNLCVILGCGSAYALPVGNPAEASLISDGLIWEGHCGCDPCDPCLTWLDAFSIRGGFYGDYVFNRNLKNCRNIPGGGGKRDRKVLEQSRLNTNAGYIALNFWDRFDFFATFGTSNLFLEGNLTSFSPAVYLFSPPATGVRLSVESSTEFSWSLGGRITLWECGGTALGIEGQYFGTNPRIKRVTWAKIGSTYSSNTVPRFRAQYSEWQIGLGACHRINYFVPYIAVKWSGARLHWQNKGDTTVGSISGLFPVDSAGFITFNDLVNHKYWGYALGVSLADCEKAAVTVEARFADERALYVNTQIRF